MGFGRRSPDVLDKFAWPLKRRGYHQHVPDDPEARRSVRICIAARADRDCPDRRQLLAGGRARISADPRRGMGWTNGVHRGNTPA